jgi:hypothetical protein
MSIKLGAGDPIMWVDVLSPNQEKRIREIFREELATVLNVPFDKLRSTEHGTIKTGLIVPQAHPDSRE